MANTFQLPSPQALDPYAVETQLARDVDNPLAMLALYRSDRGIAQQGYDAELQKQHAFAQQDLAQKMYEANLKSVVDLAKLPGGVDFAGSSGAGQSLGIDPDAWRAFSGATGLAQNAENFSKAGSGFNSFSQGGLQVPSQLIPGMPGGMTNLGPALVRAAAIRAAASGGDGDGDSGNLTISSQIAGNAAGDFHNLTQRKVRPGDVPGVLKSHEGFSEAQRASRGGGSPNTSASPTSSKSIVPPGAVKIDTSSRAGAAAQNAAMKWKQNTDPKNAVDASATMQGAAHNVYQLPDGRYAVIGARGIHPIPVGQ